MKVFDLSNKYGINAAKCYLNKLYSDKKKIEIRELKEKRSISQNNLFHLWIREIADEIGEHDYEDCKRDIIGACIGYEYKVNAFTGNEEKKDYKTSKMTKENFSMLMHKVKIFAEKDLGIYLPYKGEPGYEQFIYKYERFSK